jgi:hypothetical protein
MRDTRRDSRFATESLDDFRQCRNRRHQHFDRDDTIAARVPGLVYSTHGAVPEWLEQLIIAEHITGFDLTDAPTQRANPWWLVVRSPGVNGPSRVSRITLATWAWQRWPIG